MVLQRRLFWKVYLTLLASLVTVAVLMGSLWWLLGELPQERWGEFRIHLGTQMIPTEDKPAGAIARTVDRLGREIGADVSVYDASGVLLASHGRPVYLRGDPEAREPRHVLRIDLPDGRAVMARLRPPVSSVGLRILIAMALVAGGVGLAALPITARLTRRLETLRSGMQKWGAGDTATRLDTRGSDEVASVARTFNVAAERLDDLLTSQRALLSNASHELRSPLARLRMGVEMLTGAPDAPIRAEIVRSLGEIDQLVEEILLSTRLDHPSAFLGRPERVDLLGLAAEEAARVDAECDGVPVPFDCRPALVRRLIRNLLENAVRHGLPPIHVTVEGTGDEALVTVTDGGPGIAEGERERIFEPFYRPAGRGEEGGGWGLGLSLVKQIAERHGGGVTCDSTCHGSRFTVRLGARGGTGAARPIEPIPSGSTQAPLRPACDDAGPRWRGLSKVSSMAWEDTGPR